MSTPLEDFELYKCEDRVLLLKNICEWFLDDCVKRGLDGIKCNMINCHRDFWRLTSKGPDHEGRCYWLLADYRVYRETNSAFSFKHYFAKRNSHYEPIEWKLVCRTKEDWLVFPESLLAIAPETLFLFFDSIRENAISAIETQELHLSKKVKERERLKRLELIRTESLMPRKSNRLREKKDTKRYLEMDDEDDETDEMRLENAEAGIIETNWKFECFCGMKRPNAKEPLVSCHECGVWRHIICVNISLNIIKSWESPDWTKMDYVCEKCIAKDHIGEIDVVNFSEEDDTKSV